ncbi:MAG: head-tail connector protein [Pseudomonadota bacterium]
MALVQITPPSEEPVTLTALKAHLRVTGSSEDTLISGLGIAARRTLEARYALGMVSQDWRVTADIPVASDIQLPLSPVAAVTSVSITHNGTTTVLGTADYDVEIGHMGSIRLKSTVSAETISIEFIVGWTDASSVPEDIKLAIKMLVAHYFEHREAVDSETFHAGPESIAALMAPYKRVRL